jgi:hypothetical protein
MSFRFQIAFCILGILCSSICLAQHYCCDWSVVDEGGATTGSASYSSTASAGQAAVGWTAGATFQSFIGFWQIDTAALGVREQKRWSETEPLVTALYAPFPNPCRSLPAIRYSLAAEARVSLQLFDLAGRNVATLVNSVEQPGRYSRQLVAAGRTRLSAGVYFLKMRAGDYVATRKVVLE